MGSGGVSLDSVGVMFALLDILSGCIILYVMRVVVVRRFHDFGFDSGDRCLIYWMYSPVVSLFT